MQMRRFVLAVAPAVLVPGAGLRAGSASAGRRPAGGGRGGRAAGAEIRPYDRVITKDAKSDDGVFTVHRIKDRIYYEIPEGTARPGVPLGQPDRQDHARRRLRRAGGRQPRRPVGAARRPHPAARGLLRRRRRFRRADRQSRRGGQLRPDPDGLQHRSARQGRRGGHRRDAAVHHRRAGVQRPHARRRARVRRQPLVCRARRRIPGERRGRSDAHLQQPAGARRRRRPRRTGARRRPRRRAAPRRHAQRADALQHGEAAREADDAAPVRRARRLFLGRVRSTTAGTSTARRSAASSPAGGSRRRTPTPRSPSRSSRSSTGSTRPRRPSGCRT